MYVCGRSSHCDITSYIHTLVVMGAAISTRRLQVQVVKERDVMLLNRFFDENPNEQTLGEYFSSCIRPQFAQESEFKLKNVRVTLRGEHEAIEVSSLDDKCSDYIAMELKQGGLLRGELGASTCRWVDWR